ncbi:hypothetical protein [Cesiribacter sp. SM1]|uniref:hypothetical protein n=1 Tax=Cesiribacter sp. SM1 TaxID=2861196 RepID=UPI001CD540ED|nr:hypothetical protein [Cesiribacter sp. SM1]
MKKILPLFLPLVFMFSCEKEEVNPPSPAEREVFLKERVFNGNSKWLMTKMEADVERVINDTKSKSWFTQLAACRTDNIYLFGDIGVSVTTVAIDEGTTSCSVNEQDYVDLGMFLSFTSDFSKAEVEIEGEAMQKLFGIAEDSYLEFSTFTHTWEFKEVTESKVVINAIIIPEESAGMVEEKANVTIVFERTN